MFKYIILYLIIGVIVDYVYVNYILKKENIDILKRIFHIFKVNSIMITIFIIIYLIIGLVLSLIYDYYSPYKITMKQHIHYAISYPIIFYYGMI
jgi:hypothetical protein